MVDINGYEIKSAFSGGFPLKAIYSLGEKVWPTGPEPITWGGLKLTALESGEIGVSYFSINDKVPKPNLSYSKNGVSWFEVEFGYTKKIKVNKGDVVCFKGINNKFSISEDYYSHFYSNCKFAASGNIMSLLYGDDFEGELSLSGKDYCFYYLFNRCKITTAPELPATTLASYCYNFMFSGCTSLTTAPALPATTLADSCYWAMFSGCTSLTTAPELPATTLAESCYTDMFNGCTSLTTAPELPATTLAYRCYRFMFEDCTSLTTAPSILPATELAVSCYDSMFWKCKSLTTAPELPATTLADYCYHCMFRSCTNLNYVKANFTTTPSTNYTNSWLDGVASTGTFVANSSATWTTSITRGSSTVPAGWTITK